MGDSEIAVGYVRYSSHKQDGGLSLEVQEFIIETCAKDLGCTVQIFRDPATSAKRYAAANRKGMRELMEYVKTSQPRYLLFADEDRLSRLADDFVIDVYTEIKRYAPQCELLNAKQRRVVDPHELEGVLKFASSADENLKRSARAITAQDRMLSRREHPGQRPNYGYRYNSDDKSLEIEDDTVSVVQFIFHLAAWGHPFEIIADTLNTAAIPSPNRATWSKASIHSVVRNPIYMGTPRWSLNPLSRLTEAEFQRSLAAVNVDPIVSSLTWYRANDLTQSNRRAHKLGSPYLLRDLLSCKSCGNDARVVAKDYTPGAAERPLRVYRCLSCNRHVDIETVHAKCINRILDEWHGRLFTQARRVDKWFQTIAKRIGQNIHDLDYKLRYLETFEKLQNHDEISLNTIKEQLNTARELALRVEAFARNPIQYYATVERWGELDFWGLSVVEQRRFLIEIIDSIVYDFGGKTAPEIRYFPGPDICVESDYFDFTPNR